MLKMFILLCWLTFFQGFVSADNQMLWEYLMPPNHPAKKSLDAIFSASYAVASQETMKRAGFYVRKPRDPRQLTAGKHPFLPGYVIKAYLDTTAEIDEEWKYFVDRIIGATIIQESINRHHYTHLMKTPKKWIYPLPNPGKRKYVLVTEDMHLLSPAKNAERYFKKMDKERLDALYVILTENLLIDSIYIDNIPFCTDGKIAFIDTEHFHTTVKPLYLGKLLPKFSPSMQKCWSQLMRKGGYE